jgi:RHS repeat-associated protein
MQSLVGGQQAKAAEAASLASPGEFTARLASRTAFEGLGAEAAEKLAGKTFPSIVDDRAGALPPLSAGQWVVGYPADNAAQVDLGDGEHGVIESSEPLALETSPGRREPLDLGLSEVGGAFQPVRSDVTLRIPKDLSDGVQLPISDVSLTPIGASGSALSGTQGAIDGATVLYANTQADADTVVKPLARGFAEDTLLRSVDSPTQLSYRVGLPAGAHLAPAKDRSGNVDVVDDGAVIAVVIAPSAEDAAGTGVPVSMSASGDVLSLTVAQRPGSYEYPIEVDPTVVETGGTENEILYTESGYDSAWGFATKNSSVFKASKYYIEPHVLNGKEDAVKDEVSNSVAAGETGAFVYDTQGESKIYSVTAETSFEGDAGSKMEDGLGIFNAKTGKMVKEKTWLENYKANETVCAEASCGAGTVEKATTKGELESQVFYTQIAREANQFAGGTAKLTGATLSIVQEAGPSTSFDTSESELYGRKNGLYSGRWVSLPHNEVYVGMNASDPGLGIDKAEWHAPSAPEWDPAELGHEGNDAHLLCTGAQCEECWEVSCGAKPFGLEVDKGLPEGEDVLEGTVKDPVGLSASAKATIKVDDAPPHNITLSGLPPWNEIAFGYYKFKVSATDGSGTTPSSGVASIAVSIDGKEVGKPNGSCSPGPCTATGEWTINGEEYAAGKHTIVMTATDAAGNVAKEEATLTIHSAESKAAGPGSVELASGAFTLSATDASVSSFGGGLSVERSFNSRRVGAGVEGPFGTQWQGLSFGGNESLTKLPTGGVVYTAANGMQSLFTKEGTKFLPPAGDTNLTLTEESASGAFTLTDQRGDVTTFKVPSGGSGTLWTPSAREEPGHAGSVKYSFQTVGGVTEPTQALAPVPAGVTCTTLVKGCRALTFSYASSTTATGEAPAEWGEYKGRLVKISFTAYSPSSKAMQTTAVAQYSYDKQGRLRAEWNPQVSPALKTVYGYDAEGHVTAVSDPGQQPWLLHYGTIESDPSGGRLLSVTRPGAATAFGNEIAPVSSEAPKLSTTSPVRGTEVTVSTGVWTNSPLSYSYQWEDCNSTGGECAIIAGATNQGYTPRYSDEEHTLAVVVTASNAGGSTTASSAASAVVPATAFAPTYSLSFGSEGTTEGKFKAPSYDAATSCFGGGVAVSDTGNNRVEIFNAEGKYKSTLAEREETEGVIKEPIGIATNSENPGYVWVTHNNDAIEEYTQCEYESHNAITHVAGPLGGLSTNSTQLLLANSKASEVELFRKAGSYSSSFGKSGTGNGQFKEPADVAWSPVTKQIYVLDTGNDRVEYFSSTGTYEGQFGAAGSKSGQFKEPKGIAVDSLGDVWVVDTGNDRVESFTSTGKFLTEVGTAGTGKEQFKEPVGIALDSANDLYVVDRGNDRVEKWFPGKRPADSPLPPATPPTPGTSAVQTIEYQVPLSGSGAPDQLSSTETAKWGQTDNPVEATAIFPPDEPMGWPAKSYKRATVYYRDSKDRTVNTAVPSGAISTTEYNSSNDAVRTLSPDNRAAALKEGSKSAEDSKLLDTESTYNSEGTELQSVLGPQHTVKLAGGGTVEARDHQQYYYEEGAPSEGGPYRLVTKTTDGAEYSGKEEEVRTTTTSYSGQENLGWKLRKPTSVTTEPSGLKLTHTTLYEASTGNVTETTTPTGAAENPPPAYAAQFGNTGSESEKLDHPQDDALDSHGNLWVTGAWNDEISEFSSSGTLLHHYGSYGTGGGQLYNPVGIAVNQSSGNVYVSEQLNDRIDEFNEKGEFVETFGFGVSNGEEKLEVCTTSCRAGIAGAGTGQLNEPSGIALDSKGDIWVADYRNNRVDEFSSAGAFIETIGFGVSNGKSEFEICTSGCKVGLSGSGNGEFTNPRDVAIASGRVYVVDMNDSRVEVFNEKGEYQSQFGSGGSGNGQFKAPDGVGIDSLGNVYVADGENNRIEEFTSSGAFLAAFGTQGSGNGQFSGTGDVAIAGTGAIYVTDEGNNRVEEWVSNKGGAHTSQTIYYTTAANPTYPACGEHPEWANLACQTQPAKQPETSGLPNLPVTTYTYNIWDEPETTTEKVGSTTRTKTATYEASGRLEKSAVSSTVGTALPTVTDVYNKETGALEKQSTTSEGKTKTVTSIYNSLGELTSYTDAGENTSTYEYDIDGRIKKVNDGKGTETYTYSETSGLPTELLNEYGTTKMIFTGSYDIEGNLLTEGYPNGMSATYTYDQTGKPTKLEYVKTTHCTEKCTWFSDAVVPSIHGQWLEQTSTLSHQAYTYDGAGRLTQVQNTPTGKGCTTHVYAYEEDTNRTSLKTYEPNAKGECATEKDTEEKHTYDSADRLTDAGVKYSEFGDITNLPAADAGGSELTSAYYTDNQLQSETQNGQTIGYNLDPDLRTLETVSTGKKASDITNHYAGPGSTPAWTVNTSSGEYTRNIAGLTGFAAVQSGTEAPVLQITNLHGDIIATAYLSETATALASTADTSEFGVPTTSLPPKYSWLGADEIPTELPSGIMDMGARSYIPQLGRFLQPDPRPGGSANAYTYTFGDPVNSSDPSGEYTFAGVGSSLEGYLEGRGAEAAAQQAAENAAARAEAERKAREAEEAAEAVAGPQYEEEWEEWEEWEEEYEYVSYQHGGKSAGEEGHVEAATLVQPLGGEASREGEAAAALGSALPLCKAGSEGPCAHDARAVCNDRGMCHGGSSGRSRRSHEPPFTCPDKICEVETGRQSPSFAEAEEKSIEEQYDNGDTGAHPGNNDDGDPNTATPKVKDP